MAVAHKEVVAAAAVMVEAVVPVLQEAVVKVAMAEEDKHFLLYLYNEESPSVRRGFFIDVLYGNSLTLNLAMYSEVGGASLPATG